jgi:hypothetical protein
MKSKRSAKLIAELLVAFDVTAEMLAQLLAGEAYIVCLENVGLMPKTRPIKGKIRATCAKPTGTTRTAVK